jgi:glutamyl endopeptidase
MTKSPNTVSEKTSAAKRKPKKAAAVNPIVPSSDSARQLFSPSFMVDTNGGGSLEEVPGFNAVKARSQGFKGGRVPTVLRNDRLGVAGDIEFAQPQYTIGYDDRVLIPDPSALPWRCVCQLVVEGLHGNELLGTGWLAGPSTVITAGHNLFSKRTGHQAAKIWVCPARSGDAVPYGYDISNQYNAHPRWISDGDPECDIGVIWLSKPLGTKIGWFGTSALSDAQLKNLMVNNAGYPWDKPRGTQWYNAGRVLGVNPLSITYGLDTEKGQSGSPIFVFTPDKQRIVVAVHAYGDGPDNIGVRITPDIFRLIASWIR